MNEDTATRQLTFDERDAALLLLGALEALLMFLPEAQRAGTERVTSIARGLLWPADAETGDTE